MHNERALLTSLEKDDPDLHTDATYEPEEESTGGDDDDDDEHFENDDVVFDTPGTVSAAPTEEGSLISQRKKGATTGKATWVYL